MAVVSDRKHLYLREIERLNNRKQEFLDKVGHLLMISGFSVGTQISLVRSILPISFSALLNVPLLFTEIVYIDILIYSISCTI